MALIETLDSIRDAILDSGGEEIPYLEDGRMPPWFGHAVSDVALALDDAGIRFTNVAITYSDGGNGYAVVIHLFTDDLLVTVSAGSDAGRARTTTVRPRCGLVSMEVQAGASALGPAAEHGQWPGAVALLLRYDDGAEVKLPGTVRSQPPSRYQEIYKLVESLRRDLAQ
ncbi:hypothetical protein ACFQ8T_12605 [Isoptericola sp. NPDC056618]|uniref:hypothetical protein n=1 Tax=Isoptericola sp. NPDC056618 TaxID=3345878 RepID=UPI0036BE58D2